MSVAEAVFGCFVVVGVVCIIGFMADAISIRIGHKEEE